MASFFSGCWRMVAMSLSFLNLKCSRSSAASVIMPIARSFGVWYCVQSRSSQNFLTCSLSSLMVVWWSMCSFCTAHI